MKKLIGIGLLSICFPIFAYAASGIVVFSGNNPMGLLVQGQLSGVQDSQKTWTGTVFNGTLRVSGPLPGGILQGGGPVSLVTIPVGKDQYEGHARAIQLIGTLTIGGRICALVDSGLVMKLSIDKNNQATLEMGSNRPSSMSCPGMGLLPGIPLLPMGYRETVPILIH